MSSAESNKMSRKTPSQDLNSDPRNENDYDTWEYGTEPIPNDHTWSELNEFEKVWKEMDQIEPLTPVTAKKVDDWWFNQEVLNTTK